MQSILLKQKKRLQINLALFYTISQDFQESMFKLLELIITDHYRILEFRTSFLNHSWDYVFQMVREGGKMESGRRDSDRRE